MNLGVLSEVSDIVQGMAMIHLLTIGGITTGALINLRCLRLKGVVLVPAT